MSKSDSMADDSGRAATGEAARGRRTQKWRWPFAGTGQLTGPELAVWQARWQAHGRSVAGLNARWDALARESSSQKLSAGFVGVDRGVREVVGGMIFATASWVFQILTTYTYYAHYAGVESVFEAEAEAILEDMGLFAGLLPAGHRGQYDVGFYRRLAVEVGEVMTGLRLSWLAPHHIGTSLVLHLVLSLVADTVAVAGVEVSSTWRAETEEALGVGDDICRAYDAQTAQYVLPARASDWFGRTSTPTPEAGVDEHTVGMP